MTNPYLPNPDAAVSTSADLTTAGQQLKTAVDGALSRITALQGANPWGSDEAGLQYQQNLGTTTELDTAMKGVGDGITGFGNVAQTGVQNIIDLDTQQGSTFDDIKFRR